MIRKSIKKFIIPFLLSCVLLFSGCASCKGKTGEEQKSTATVRGTHIQNVTESNEDIIANGKTEYKILIPKDASSTVLTAAEELKLVFSQASGIELMVISDDAYEQNGKYFSIGKTALLAAKNLTPEQELGADGFRIVTQDSSVFTYGYKDSGALNGVYELLAHLFDYDVYFSDWIVFNKEVTDLKLSNFDIKEIPDFSVRLLSMTDKVWKRRLRINLAEALQADALPYQSETEAKIHNSIKIIDQSTYNDPNKPETYHPDWFLDSDIKNPQSTQLCFSAHGNEAEWELMMEEVVDKMKDAFVVTTMPKEETLGIHFDIADNARKCTCSGCTAAVEQYGSLSGLMVKCCNRISELLSEWMETEEGQPYKREFLVIFIAYESMGAPPVKLNEATGEMEATIKCYDNVVPQYCFYSYDALRSVYADVNTATRDDMVGWKKSAKEMFAWLYSANYTNYLHMFDNFGEMQELYQYAYDQGVSILYDEGTRQMSGQPGFYIFKYYLNAKLLWNVDSDMGELTDKFFKNYFGPAADTMLELFNQHRVYNAGLKNSTEIVFGGGMAASIWMDMNNAEFWDLQLVKSWYEMCNDAIEEVQKLQNTDPVAYTHYTNHIALERLSYIYTLVGVFETNFTLEEVNKLKLTFRDDVTRLNVSHATHKAMGDMSNLLLQWGV